jgi:hypothetical protein
MEGYRRMCGVIEPEAVICYAKPFPEMYDFANVIEVPYARNERTAPMTPRVKTKAK